MADPEALQAKLKALSDIYAAQLPEKIGQLEQAWRQLQQTGWNEEGAESLRRMVHGLAGAGKTFGFSLLSDVARKLESYVEQLPQPRIALNAEQRHHIEELMRELHQASLRGDVARGK